MESRSGKQALDQHCSDMSNAMQNYGMDPASGYTNSGPGVDIPDEVHIPPISWCEGEAPWIPTDADIVAERPMLAKLRYETCGAADDAELVTLLNEMTFVGWEYEQIIYTPTMLKHLYLIVFSKVEYV